MADRYWVGGNGTWNASSTTNWAASSGGASGASAPTLADNVFFDVNSNVGTAAFAVTITGNSGVCANFTASGLDGVLTLTVGGNWSIYGSVSFPATNLTLVSSSGQMSFAATTTGKTITTNGITIPNISMIFSGVGGGWTLQDNITFTGTEGYISVNDGTVNLNDKTITGSLFRFAQSSNSTRTISTTTSATINLYGNNNTTIGTNGFAVSNLTISGILNFNLTYAGSVGSRSCIVSSGDFSATQAQKININVTGGTDSFGITFSHNNLNFTGFSGTYSNNSKTIYGTMTLTAAMTLTGGTQTTTFGATSGTISIDSLGKTFDFPITFDGVGGTFQLAANLTVGGLGTNRTVTLTNGALDLNSKVLSCSIFSTNNANTRTLGFGTGSITLTGNAATIWTSVTVTGLTLSGTPVVNCTYSGATGTRTVSPGVGHTEANSISFNITAGTDIIGHSNGATFKDLNFTGFSGTLTDGGATMTIYGDFTLSSTMTNTGSTSGVTFAATSGTKTFTTGGIVFNNPVTINGVGGTFQLVGNLTMSTVTYVFTLTNGTFNANGYNVTIGLFSSSNSNIRALQMGGGIWTILGSGASTWLLTTSTNMTLTNSSSMIDLTSTTAKTFAGGSLSYGTLRNTGSGALTMTGTNTFLNLRALANLTLTSSTTTTISNTFSMDGRYGSLVYLTSSAAANATISKASGKVYTTFCNISKITATGGATFRAPATPLTSYGNVDGGTNSGWTFTAMGATDNPNPGAFSSFFN
jgi:hypothetical protein